MAEILLGLFGLSAVVVGFISPPIGGVMGLVFAALCLIAGLLARRD